MRREVGAEDIVAVAEEDAETERFAVLVDAGLRRLRSDAEIDVEVASVGRHPRDRPAHPLLVRVELFDRGSRHQREGRVASVQVSEVADLIDEHRAPAAANILVRTEHEVVEEQLRAPFEQVGQRDLAFRAFEGVLLLDPDSRKAAAPGRERVPRPGRFFLLDEQCVTRCLPLGLGDDGRKVHDELLSFAGSDIHDPISIEGDPLPGWVNPGTLAGDTATQIPRATRAAATTGASREPCGRAFSAKIATVTSAIQKRLITPSTKRTSIRPPDEPTQSTPCARPLLSALSGCRALRHRRRLRRFTGVNS